MLRANHDGNFPCRRTTSLVPKLSQHTRRSEDRGQEERRGEDRERRRPHVETLEPRYLMTATPNDWESSFGGACTCSICTGASLQQIAGAATTTVAGAGTLATTSPLSAIPQLSSNSSATAKLFLDFNGHTQASWGGYSNVITPVYDQDGDRTTFSAGELNSIQEIWARVSEDFAAFNIDVTTIDPGSSADRVVARIAIGGNYSDWFGSPAGGVAYIGGFYNGAPNVGYVFEDALGNGHARYVAEAASHEAGHLFGLMHQSLYSGTTLVDEYYEGNAAWAPIMGVGYSSQRTTWYNGTSTGPSTYQDDMSILANASNGFGYRADDYGSTQSLAAALAATAGSVNIAGQIGSNTDQDWFTFTTGGGALNLSVNVAQFGANLDSVLELRDATGTVLVTANPTNSLNATVSTNLASGTYFVVVRSSGGYGNIGRYTLSGTAPVGTTDGSGGEDTSAPEINVLNGTTALQSGGAVSFGTVQVGQGVNRTLTVRNTGTGPLTLTPLTAEQLPAGYSLVSNFGTSTLASGASTTFTIRFMPTAAGTTTGVLTLISDDSDEGAFTINLTGNATPAPAPEISVLHGTVAVASGGTVNFGTVQVSKYVNKTLTIKNTGNATLTLVRPTAADMPAGYSIVTNLASTTLAAGASTTITLRYTPTTAGTNAGTLTLVSNDSDEAAYVLNLSGVATPGPQPEINVNVGTLVVQSGGNIDFGNVQVSKYANKVITVKNTGTAALTLVKPTALQMPAGFTIVTNFARTSLAAGASASITVRYTPTAVGAASGTLNLVSNDADEGSFALHLAGTGTPGPEPEINLAIGTTAVQTGGSVEFGSLQVGQFINKTITIKNTGPGTLTLQKLVPANMPPGFTIVTNLGLTALATNRSTSFTIRFTPSAVGAVSESITLLSNDADESSFVINLNGTGTPAPIIRAIDNGAAGFTSTGTWTRSTYVGRERDIQTAVKGTGNITATWTFSSMPPGVYRVHASWTASVGYATNAPFTVFDGDTQLGTVLANQERASSGFTWGGTAWSNLGTFEITGDTVRVMLTNAANDRVVADAVRIERIGDLPAPEGGAAASSTLHALPLPNFTAPADGAAPAFSSAATSLFWASASTSLGSGANVMTTGSTLLSPNSVDEVFAASDDAGAELLLLDRALDLVRTTTSAITGSNSTATTSSDELELDSLPPNWLAGDELSELLG